MHPQRTTNESVPQLQGHLKGGLLIPVTHRRTREGELIWFPGFVFLFFHRSSFTPYQCVVWFYRKKKSLEEKRFNDAQSPESTSLVCLL